MSETWRGALVRIEPARSSLAVALLTSAPATARAEVDGMAVATLGLVGLLTLLLVVLGAVVQYRRRKETVQALLTRVKIYMGENNRRPADAARAIEEWSNGNLSIFTPELHRLYIQALYEAGRENRLDEVIAAYPVEGQVIPERYLFARVLESSGRLEKAAEQYKVIARQDAEYADVKMRFERVTGKSTSDMELSMGLDPHSIPRYLGTKYKGMELIGKGGMGFVFKAFDSRRKRHVAIKVLSPFLIDEDQALNRFLREAKLLSKFEHPNVVKIFDVEEKPIPYYTMEFVAGRTLGHRIEDHGAQPVEEVLSLAQAVLSGLAHVHKHGVVHRDIKPENILLQPDGTPTLTDFGLAVGTQATRITQTGQVMGTLRYMPPEQLRGEETGPSGDLFSLGICLYECLTGFHAFEGEDRLQRKLVGRLEEVTDREIPIGLVSLIELMMEPRVENRVQTAVECIKMVRALRREVGRKGPATFLRETLLLKDRSVRSIGSFFAGLSHLGVAERTEFFEEQGNVRDLKLLVWTLNEQIGNIQVAGQPPPGCDPRAWARDTGALRNDLAKFVRTMDMNAVDAFALRSRRLDKDLDAFLDPFRLNVTASVLQPLEDKYQGKLMITPPTHEIGVYGCPEVEAAREEVRTGIECLIEGALPKLTDLEIKIRLKQDEDVWSLELHGPAIETDYVKASLHFESMGAEVGFQEPGVFKVWLPVVMENRESRDRERTQALPPVTPDGSASSGGEEVVEEPV